MNAIKPLAVSRSRAGCDINLGGFGGCFDLKAAGCKVSLLISGTEMEWDYQAQGK